MRCASASTANSEHIHMEDASRRGVLSSPAGGTDSNSDSDACLGWMALDIRMPYAYAYDMSPIIWQGLETSDLPSLLAYVRTHLAVALQFAAMAPTPSLVLIRSPTPPDATGTGTGKALTPFPIQTTCSKELTPRWL
ncbi:hypothetical protein EVG20_g7450 [Dentipellis fragilis]|uniref:Uncharacterized protein n=1 Tax=Dentipellis fragilis TaxID=205917 RepID=A0A4Y9YDD4_9AGAM|nr:hypothetical protein EVG20_g7450 [Dentipellis fragilis]